MTLKVMGAGLCRTGTYSLMHALEKLLGARCYHMAKVFGHPEHWSLWREAAAGKMPDWRAMFSGYIATVDTPVALFWPELMQAFPDALVLLSVRDAESWYESCRQTVFEHTPFSHGLFARLFLKEMRMAMAAVGKARFADGSKDKETCIRFFEEHNDRVRKTVPAHRLIIWQPGDGWEPLCSALHLPIPSEPYPHTNKTENWMRRPDNVTKGEAMFAVKGLLKVIRHRFSSAHG